MTKQLCMITLDWRLYPNKIVGAHDQPNKVLKLNFSEFIKKDLLQNDLTVFILNFKITQELPIFISGASGITMNNPKVISIFGGNLEH